MLKGWKDERDARCRRIAVLGGLATMKLTPPAECPRCGKSMAGRPWHSYLGHLGLHGTADAYFDGDIEACQEHLRRNGLAKQDVVPENGAFRRYVPLAEVGDA